MPDIVMLAGHDLTPATLAHIAEGAEVALADSGLAAMARTRALLMTAIEQNRRSVHSQVMCRTSYSAGSAPKMQFHITILC